MQQDICYIFQDGLLTYRKKKEDCVCHVWENYIFVLLTRLTLRECVFSSLCFPSSKIPVLLSLPWRGCVCCSQSSSEESSVSRVKSSCSVHGRGSSSDCLPLPLEMGSAWMCHNKHLELRADKCPPLFSWQSLWVELVLHR